MSEHRHIGPLFSAEEEACLTHVQMHDYATGKISPADKHTVELHLLNCELCALAFEGIEVDAEGVAAGAEAITAEAWERVAALEKKRKRGAFVWMSSAAAILMLILVGFFVIDSQQEKNLNSLADSMYDLPESPLAGSEESFAEATVPMDKPEDEKNQTVGSGKFQSRNQSGGDMQSVLEKAPKEVTPLLDNKSQELVDVEFLIDEDAEMVEEEVSEYYSGDKTMDVPVTSAPPAPAVNDQFAEAITSTVAKDVADPFFKEREEEEEGWANGGDFLETMDTVEFRDGEIAGGYMAVDGNADDDMDNVIETDAINGVEGVEVQREEVVNLGNVTNSVSVEQKLDRSMNSEVSESIVLNDAYDGASGKGKKEGKDRRAKESPKRNRDSGALKSETAKSFSKNESLSNNTDYYRRGLEAYENRDFAKGARYLRQAASDAPANMQAHFYAGLCFMEMEQHTAALFHLDRIISQPQNSLTEDAMWYKSIALIRLGQKEKAEEVLEGLRDEDGKRRKDAEKALKKF